MALPANGVLLHDRALSGSIKSRDAGRDPCKTVPATPCRMVAREKPLLGHDGNMQCGCGLLKPFPALAGVAGHECRNVAARGAAVLT